MKKKFTIMTMTALLISALAGCRQEESIPPVTEDVTVTESAVPTDAPVPTRETAEEAYVFHVSDTLVSVPVSEEWEIDNSDSPDILYVWAEDYDVYYSDSFVDVNDSESLITLCEDYGFSSDIITPITLNGGTSFMVMTNKEDTAFGTITNIIAFQDIGLDTYAEVDIDYYGECSTAEEALQIVSGFALAV